MKWSPAKTQRMVFRPLKCTPLEMFFGSDKIMPQKTIESLGVLIDRDCVPSSQIQRVCGSVKTMTSLVRKNFRQRPEKLFPEIYNIYVLPKISYCSEQWHTGKEVNIHPIVREVKNFWKLSSSKKPLKDFLWPREQLIYNDLVLMNKIVHENSVVDFEVFFKRSKNNYGKGKNKPDREDEEEPPAKIHRIFRPKKEMELLAPAFKAMKVKTEPRRSN